MVVQEQGVMLVGNAGPWPFGLAKEAGVLRSDGQVLVEREAHEARLLSERLQFARTETELLAEAREAVRVVVTQCGRQSGGEAQSLTGHLVGEVVVIDQSGVL